MEITWLIVAVLALAAVVFAMLMMRAQGANGFIRSELETTRKELEEARVSLAASEKELLAATEEIRRLGETSSGQGRGADSEPETEEHPQTIIRRVEPADTAQQDSAVQDDAGEVQRTVLFKPPAVDEPEDDTIGAPYLKLGSGGEEESHLLAFGSTWVGREQGNDIVIADGAASRRHFEITYTDNRFRLRDNGSTNGTKHNGDKAEEAWLEFGDTITVGETDMLFSCEGFDLRDSDAAKAVESLQHCVRRQPDFISALKILAFMLERDVGRKSEAAPLWDAIARLEK